MILLLYTSLIVLSVTHIKDKVMLSDTIMLVLVLAAIVVLIIGPELDFKKLFKYKKKGDNIS